MDTGVSIFSSPSATISMEPSEETAHITSQVAILDSKIRELNKERAALLRRLNRIRSLIISRIPTEVLLRIFWFATRPYDSSGRPRKPYLSDTKALFDLRVVCSYWRCVTQSSPQLWTTLALVQKNSYSQTEATDYVGLVKHYYRRLGAGTMSLYISDLHRLADTTIDEIVRVTLKDYPEKLSLLHVEKSMNRSAWPAILKYAKENTEFTQLEKLELEWQRLENKPQENSLFRNSPRLRTLSLDGDGSPQIPLEFPWRQITTLKLNNTSPKYSFQLLMLCPNLVNYQFSYVDDDNKPWAPPQRQIITLPFLRDLTWLVKERGNYTRRPKPVDPQFFVHFRFPAVRKLHWYAPLPSDAPSVRGLFANMRELEELKTSLSEWQQYCINQHLSVFSSLTTLRMDVIDMEEGAPQWLWRLTIKHGKNNLMPRLQRLHLEMDDIAPPDLIVVLYSRRNGPVDWLDPEQDPEELVLPPYDPTSSHWQHHARLLEFSNQPPDGTAFTDWTQNAHHEAMKAMMSEAKKVEGFGEFENCYCRILF